jgi:hypothetical protein
VEDVQKTWWLPVNHEPRTPPSSLTWRELRTYTKTSNSPSVIKGRAPTNYPDRVVGSIKDRGGRVGGRFREGVERRYQEVLRPRQQRQNPHPGNESRCSHRRGVTSQGRRPPRQEPPGSEDVCSSYRGHHIRSVTARKHHVPQRTGAEAQESNICDNFRCALHLKNAGQKMGGGGL